MSAHDKSDHVDKHDMDRAREQMGDRKDKTPAPGGKPVQTTGGKPTQPADPAKIRVNISNGAATSLLANGPNGLTLAVKSPGTITVSNGTNSITMPGTSLVLSGSNVKLAPGCTGCTLMINPAGGYTVLAGSGYDTADTKGHRVPPPPPSPGVVTGGP